MAVGLLNTLLDHTTTRLYCCNSARVGVAAFPLNRSTWLTPGKPSKLVLKVFGGEPISANTIRILATPPPPPPPPVDGVTVTVATTGTVPLFTAVKLAILPVPLAASPMLGVLFVQLNVVPATGLVKFTGAVGDPLHNTWLATGFTDGVGFTVIVNVIGAPLQLTPPNVALGVTVIVATTGAFVLLIAVKLAILPTPLAARPIVELLFVQLNTVPATVPLNVTAAVEAPLHTVWFATGETLGEGFTVIVNVVGVPLHVTPPLV